MLSRDGAEICDVGGTARVDAIVARYRPRAGVGHREAAIVQNTRLHGSRVGAVLILIVRSTLRNDL
jgi:hypothetical protein